MNSPADIVWRPLSPRYRIQAFLEVLLVVGPIILATSIPLWIGDLTLSRLSWYPLAVGVLVAVLSFSLVPRWVAAIGYQLREDDLIFRRGILFRRQVAVPYGRLQLVDVSRGPVSRMLGLSELRLVTAAVSTGVSIPGLPAKEAEDLRDHLISVAETRRAGL